MKSQANPRSACRRRNDWRICFWIVTSSADTGSSATTNLLKQIAPFGTTLHFGQEVTVVRKDEHDAAGRFYVETSKGRRFLTKTIFIAGGMGSFQPRLLRLEGLDAHVDSQVFYRVRNPAQFTGKNLVIAGGGDSALDWTLSFAADGPARATGTSLVHRRDGFSAAPASVARMKELVRAGRMNFIVGQPTGIVQADGHLIGIEVTTPRPRCTSCRSRCCSSSSA